MMSKHEVTLADVVDILDSYVGLEDGDFDLALLQRDNCNCVYWTKDWLLVFASEILKQRKRITELEAEIDRLKQPSLQAMFDATARLAAGSDHHRNILWDFVTDLAECPNPELLDARTLKVLAHSYGLDHHE